MTTGFSRGQIAILDRGVQARTAHVCNKRRLLHGISQLAWCALFFQRLLLGFLLLDFVLGFLFRLLPASRSAAVVSIDIIRACGCGDRSRHACNIPGNFTSTVNGAAPVTLARPLMRGIDLPITASCALGGSGGASPAGGLTHDLAQRHAAYSNRIFLRTGFGQRHDQVFRFPATSSMASNTCG